MTGGAWRYEMAVAVTGQKTPPFGDDAVSTTLDAGTVQSLAFGTGTLGLEVDQLRHLPAGGSETLNLYDGSLTDVFGDAAPFRVVRSFVLFVESGGDAAGVTVTGGVSNPTALFWVGTTPGQTVYPGGPACSGGSAAGVNITSSACTLKVTNNGAAQCSYRLMVAGDLFTSGMAVGTLGLTYP